MSEIRDLPLATVLETAERLFAGVMDTLAMSPERLHGQRDKGGCVPAQFAGCIQIPLCAIFLKELQRRGIPIPEQEWLVEEFDAAMAEQEAA